jgi:hypothetical protein
MKDGVVDRQFQGATVTFGVGGELLAAIKPGRWMAGPPRPARALDLLVRAEDQEPTRAIYKIVDNQLTLCVARRPGLARPEQFSAERDEPFRLIVLTRAKK